ncbi:MAG: BT4734/BF3469 family protein [Thermoguttaceae bacterium]
MKDTMIANDELLTNATTAFDGTEKTEEKKGDVQNHEDTDMSNTASTVGTTSKVDRYTDKIEPIQKSNRNTELHRRGLCLRGKYGLVGHALEAALQKINQKKCTPPLQKDEVKTICRSVDKSKVMPGQSGTGGNGAKGKRRTSAPVYRTVNVISVSDVSIPVANLLDQEVSTYDNCLANMPSGTYTIDAMLEAFKTDKEINTQIIAIRTEQDKERRSELKKKLPAVVFGSKPQAARSNDACAANGVLCLDFDCISANELESAKQAIAAVPYVFAAGLSASGGGLFALVHYEGTPDLKPLLAAMQSDFLYEIDKSRSDLCGLRYATFDENLIIKDEVFSAILTERQEPVDDIEPLGEIVRCGVESLDNILAKIEAIDWVSYYTAGKGGEIKPPSERDYLLRTVERVLDTADKEDTPLLNRNGCIHYFTGTHYKQVLDDELGNFLIEAAIRCGVPRDVAVYHLFVDKIVKQFMINSARHNSRACARFFLYFPASSSVPCINSIKNSKLQPANFRLLDKLFFDG